MQTKTQKEFIKPHAVLFQAGLKSGQSLADFGTGSGYYALAGAEIVGPHGQVHAFDVKDSALDHLSAEARVKGFRTVKTYQCDLDEAKLKCKLPTGECDMAVIANVLHEVENKKVLLQHIYESLKTGGRLLVVDWNDNPGPIGPVAEKRIRQDEAKKLIETCSLRFVKQLESDQYHFALLFEK